MSRATHFLSWSSQAPEEVAPGVRLLARRGRAIEVARVVLGPGTTLAEHAHPEEQFFCVLEGRLQYRVGEEERVAVAGEAIHIPGNVVHGGRVVGEDEVVLIEVKQVSPGRTDGTDGPGPEEGS